MKNKWSKKENVYNKAIWKNNTFGSSKGAVLFCKAKISTKQSHRAGYKLKQKYVSIIPSKQTIKSTAYQGEISNKVEQSKRRKINTPKKISKASFKEAYFNKNSIALPNQRHGVSSALPYGMCSAQQKAFSNYVLYYKKKAWYTDKAAPIPGGNFKIAPGFRRKDKVYKKTLGAYKLFKTYQTFNKKAISKQYRKRANRNFVCNNSMEFSILMHTDSLFNSSLSKSSLCNFKELFQPYFLNGKYTIKKNFVLYRRNKAFQKDGDFCSCLNQQPLFYFILFHISLL